jgi:hypothetical protein
VTKDEWYDNLDVNYTLTLKDTLKIFSPDLTYAVQLKTFTCTFPSEDPILRIDRGILAMKDLSALGYLSSVSKTVILMPWSPYTNCVPSDIGKRVKKNGEFIPNVVLADYDNSNPPNRKWVLSGSASVNSGAELTIDNGTGAGTASSSSSTYGGGAIKIGHGLTGETDPPKISLMDSDQGYHTLHIKMADGTTPAHLNLGNLTATGTITLGSSYPQLSQDSSKLKMLLNYSGVTLKIGVGNYYDVSFETNFVFFSFNTNVIPATTNSYSCGHSSRYWQKVYAGTYYGKNTSIQYFDALDDLALLKNHKVKKVMKDGVEVEVVDVDSLPHLKPDEEDASEFYDTGKMHGYLIGCMKALLLRLEKLEAAGKQNA